MIHRRGLDYRDVLRELRAIANSQDVTSADWRAWEVELAELDSPAVRYMEGER